MAKQKKQEEPIEKALWKAADKLRKNIDAAEYKHVVLGLVFLKYISDSFEELYEKLNTGEGEFVGADPEDKDEYKAENVFFVPPAARWSYLVANAKLPTIGKLVDEAMDAIEKENRSLKGVLPKVYVRDNLDAKALGGLIDLIGNIALGDAKSRSADVLGHVFEYFLGEFALAEGKQGGQFYTPKSVVELLVKMLEPYKGRVFDPCCGSGGIMRYVDSFLYDKESILIPRKGTLSNLFYIDEPFWTVDTLFWSKVNTEKVSGKFLFFFLKTMDLSNLNVGSAVPSLTTKVLNEIKLFLPSLDEQKQFNEYADSAWDKMTKNKEQIKTLEKMRDTLLPKLMSGEVRVKI